MSEMLLQLRVTADGKVAVQEVTRTADSLRAFEAETKRVGVTTDEAKRKTDAWVAALLRKNDTLGMSWSALKKYEAAQLSLSEAEKKNVGIIIDSIDKHERYGAAAEKVGRVLGGLAATALSAGVAMAGVIVKESIQAAVEAEQANLKVEAVLKATGHAAGMTAKDLDDLAQSMAASTQFDDEAIKNASAILLTFRSVSKDSFGDAMQAAVDLASVMGTDLNSAVLMIGKALEQPEHGLTALTRAGIQFTDAQKDTIKSLVEQGEKAEAVKLILQELKSQGLDRVAQAMNTGLGKATSDLKKGWNELLEEIGRTDAVGGTATRYMTGLTQIMKDLQDQISGTSDRFRNFFKSEEFLGSKVFSALRQLGMSDPYTGTPKQPPKKTEADHAEELAAQDGRAIKWQKDQIELHGRRAKAAQEAAEKESAAYAKVVKSSAEYLASLEKQVASVGATTEQKIMLEAATRSLALKTTEERSAFLASAAALAHQVQVEEDAIAAKKKAAEDTKKILELEKKKNEEMQRGTDALQKELDALIKSNDEYGKSREMIEADTLAKMEAELASKDFTTSTYEEITALEQRIAIQEKIVGQARRGGQLEKQTEEVRNQVALYDEVSSRVANVATGISKWTDELKYFGQELAALLVKRWVLQLVAGVTGSTALGAAASSVGQGSLAGSLLPGGLGLFEGAGVAAPGMGVTVGLESLAINAGMTSLATSGAISAIVSAVPYVAIAVALYSMFSRRGGPKEGGSYSAQYDANGNFVGTSSVPGTDNGRFFTPSQADAEVRNLVGRYAAGYFSRLSTLGGASTGATFSLGFDRDPRGTASSRVSNSVIIGGREVYRSADRSVDDEAIADELALEIKRGILAGLQASNLEQDIGDILRTLDASTASSEAIDNVIALAEAYKNLDDIIADMSGTPAEVVARAMEGMHQQVEAGQRSLDAALSSGEQGEILAAEQQLQQAVLNRYNTELQMIRQLQDAIAAVREQAYQFSVQMAQRINAVGGSRDVAGIAMGRATTLRAGIGGNAPVGSQIRDLNGYVGAIDTWYQSRRSEIESQVAAEQAAQQAIGQAQQAAAQARIAQLQGELEVAEQFQSVVDRTREMIDQMRLTASNPLALAGRLGLATADAQSLRGTYNAASGTGRVDAAGRYLDALQTRLGLAQDAFQRPSPEYQAIYNEIIAELTRVQGDAKTEAERSLDLQARLADLQAQANGYAAATASASAASQGYLDALNAEARGYYEYAEAEGERLFAEQERQHQEQLDAITDGMEPELYIAQMQRETVTELREIKELIREWLNTPGGPAAPASNSPTDGSSSPDSVPKSTTFVLELDGQVLAKAIAPAVDSRISKSGTVIKRALQNA